MASSKTQKIMRYVLVGVGFALVVGFLVYYFVIDVILVNNQKKSFDKAEASITMQAEEIQQTIGRADETKTEKSCSYINQEIGRGPRSCDVQVSLLYKNSSADRANTLMGKSSEILSTNVFDHLGRTGVTRFVQTAELNHDQIFYGRLNGVDALSCGIQYSFPLSQSNISYGAETNPVESLEISLSCSGPAKKEFYPLRD